MRQIYRGGEGGNVLIQVGKEPLHKVLLTRINIHTICFPPLERLRPSILISFLPRKKKKKKKKNKFL